MVSFSHLDERGRPRMVDVGGKKPSKRTAKAHAIVALPKQVYAALRKNHNPSGKGPVMETAILAGIMGAKQTADLIPLCHPLPLSNCELNIQWSDDTNLEIISEVSVDASTGVEMEALTAVTIAALTIYDMCKALSHEIVIRDVRLLSKSGGKRDFDPQ